MTREARRTALFLKFGHSFSQKLRSNCTAVSKPRIAEKSTASGASMVCRKTLFFNLLFYTERVRNQELPQNYTKCGKKGWQKGRAKRAPLLMRPLLHIFAVFGRILGYFRK